MNKFIEHVKVEMQMGINKFFICKDEIQLYHLCSEKNIMSNKY